jgi:hypothetical protein
MDGSSTFSFIDPFGATGMPFSEVKELVRRPRWEVLLNFDSDGLSRIFKAGDWANHETSLNQMYGDECWKDVLSPDDKFSVSIRKALNLYKQCLLKINGVKYAYPYEMRNERDVSEYFLIFASHHPTGLEKMKEAMKKVGQEGEYRFSDAYNDQLPLFDPSDAFTFGSKMAMKFRGKNIRYAELHEYSLQETPFTNPKKMLKSLELDGRIKVTGGNPDRKSGTFSDEELLTVTFSE